MKNDETAVLLEDLDDTNITSILKKWQEVVVIKKQLDDMEEMLKNKIKAYLKERQWDKYRDNETDISVAITMQRRELIDKKQLKEILTEAQYLQIAKTSTSERMIILTPEARERMKKYVK